MDKANHRILAGCNQLLEAPENQMSFTEQYEELLKIAGGCHRRGVITKEEKNALIVKATEHYASAVKGLEEGT